MSMKNIFLLCTVIVEACGLLVSSVYAESIPSFVDKGNAFYSRQKFDESLTLYQKALTEHPDATMIHYNKGIVEYRKARFKEAVDSFEKALTTSDKELEKRANFNLGNAKYKYAEALREKDVASAVQALEGALKSYKRVIELSPADKDAKVNYELSDKLLQELKNKLDQQQKQQCERPQEKGQDKKEEQQSSENKDQQQKQKEQEQEKKEQDKAKQEEQQKTQEQDAQSREEREKPGDERQKPASAQQAEEQNAKEMSPQEAMMLLEGARQEENTFGKLRDKEKSIEQEVVKDW